MNVKPLRYVDADDWRVAAACHGHSDLFFPPDESESRLERRDREASAKAICGGCEVQTFCLDEAIADRERHGIWGGLNDRERRAVAARRSEQRTDGRSPQDTAGPGRLARLPAVVVQGRRSSPAGG